MTTKTSFWENMINGLADDFARRFMLAIHCPTHMSKI